MADRRRMDRLSPLVIRAEFPWGGGRQHGYMTNLSEAGAFLATDENLGVGETLSVHFVLPWGLGEHDATADVIWRSDTRQESSLPTGVGLAFSDLEDGVRDAIRRYMQRFFEILAQIDEHGLNEVLTRLASSRSETVH